MHKRKSAPGAACQVPRRARWLALLVAWSGCAFSQVAAAASVVAVVTDGPTALQETQLDLIRREVADLVRGEFQVSFPEAHRQVGAWSVASVRAALGRALADPQVDIVLTMGLLASNEAARLPRPSKPLIAAVVPDARLQGFPLQNGVSGRANFVYISSVTGIDEEIRRFREIVGFDQLTVMVDAVSLAAIPQFRVKAAELAAAIGIRIDVVAVGSTVEETLAALPPGTEAVYVTPLWQLDPGGMRRLAVGLIERQLPSLSLRGRREVEAGLLMSIGGLPADDTRFARRVGLNIQRILLGDDPGRIEVGFRLGRRLLINMRTARAIGFLPRWAVLIDAEKLYDEEVNEGAALTFVNAMLEAADANLARQAAEFDVLVAGEDIRSARSAILPQLDLSATGVRIDADRANPLIQPERSVDAQVGGRQLLYSERAWSSVDIAKRLEAAAQEGYAAVILDTFQSGATAYLSLLRAEALEAVRASNLEVTRTNLELARVRESIGASGRADVLRWESTIARDRQELLAAQAVKFQARTELNRVLNREQHTPVRTVRDGLSETLAVLEDERFSRFIGNPLVWETFIDFSVAEALELAPEMRQVEETVLAQERGVLAARRAWYVPDVALTANAGRNLSRGGAGSNLTGLPIDDESWTIALNASLPLFTSGALRARLSSAQYALAQLERRAALVAQSIEARMRVALHQVGGSFPAIELSDDAANAAQANLELVIDAYSKGAVSVTALIDAQDAALAARLAAAEAEYAFLIDYMEVLRSRGSFDLLLEPLTIGRWYSSIEAYFNERGVSPIAR